MTLKLYDDDPYLLDFEAELTDVVEHAGAPAWVLDRTAFYMEGGGQPADQGLLAGQRVVGVVEHNGRILHLMPQTAGVPLQPGARVRGQVDGARRRDHRQQHHGQHLLSRALLEGCGARTVGFHLGPRVVQVDLDRPLDLPALRRAARVANTVVSEARPVAVRCVGRAEALALGCELPDEAVDSVRLVSAEGFDLQPCGGTHPRCTAEVGAIVVLGAERHKGGTRLSFVCGERALAECEGAVDALRGLGAAFSCPAEELPAVARRTLDELAAARSARQADRERLLRYEAGALHADALRRGRGEPLVVEALRETSDPEELRLLARELQRLEVPLVALAGRAPDRGLLLLARRPGSQVDLAGALRAGLELLEGRGGGRGDLVQGAGPRLERLAAALQAALHHLGVTRAT